MIKIGVFGAGTLGSIHLQILGDIPDFEVVGIYDSDVSTARLLAEKAGVPVWEDPKALLDACDAIDIVSPVASHFELAKMAMKRFRHVFIEKPVTSTIEEARTLMSLAREAQVKAQVGHQERFNPAYLALKEVKVQPMFIEAQRMARWSPGHANDSVILDLMIHDIDVVLSLVPHEIKRVSASGVAVVNGSPDIANARIEFNNGCVANLTASRISLENTRKMRIFQRNVCLALDFLNKETEVFHINAAAGLGQPVEISEKIETDIQTKYRTLGNPEMKMGNPIRTELEAFAAAISNDTPPLVTLEQATDTLECAFRIVKKINHLCVV